MNGLAAAPPPGTNPAPPTSTATKVAVTAGIVGLAIAAMHIFTAASTVHEIYKASRKAHGWLKNRDPSKPPAALATGGRRVAYRVDLDQDPEIESIRMDSNDRATLYRSTKSIVTFKPSTYQKTKIRSGSGEVLIFVDQL